MHGEAAPIWEHVEVSPLEQELRDALGAMANLAARVELARDLGEITDEAAERVQRIAGHLGTIAHRIGSGGTWLEAMPTPPHSNGNGHGNGHANGNGSRAHSNGHAADIKVKEHGDNGNDAARSDEVQPDTQEHASPLDIPQARTDSAKSDAELFIEIPQLVKDHFSPEEYKRFSDRDVAVAMHFLQNRGDHISVKEMVNSLAGEVVAADSQSYDTLRKGVSTSLKKIRETELGERYLRDNGLPTKARRYMLLTEGEAHKFPVITTEATPQEALSHEEQEARAAQQDKLFSAFLPFVENDPKGNVPCVVLGDTMLQIGNETYEYRLLGMKPGSKPTTIGVYNGLVKLLVKQGRSEIQPSELTELLGFESSSLVGTTFKKFQDQFSEFPFIRTGIAKATRYTRNPNVFFTDVISAGDEVASASIEETTHGHDDTETIIEPEAPEFPKTLTLTEWGLTVCLDQEGDDTFVSNVLLGDEPLKLRDITVSTLLTLAATRQSILQTDLLETMKSIIPEVTAERLRGCLHEIRNTLEYHDADKHLYQRQMPERDGVADTLWNLNGIIDGNGVSDFLVLSTVTDR